METNTKLGRVSLVPRGEYDPEAQYERLDIVRYGGSSYLALRDLQGVTPEDGAGYMLIAERGESGPQGLAGETGPQGVQGEKGDAGDTGPVGPKGDTGEIGPKGDMGEAGPVGPKGDTGAPGIGIQDIERTSGTGAPGTADIYTITMTDGSTAELRVYNGADGDGAGDMMKSTYDPKGKNIDIFDYVDESVKNVKVDVDETPIEDSRNPVSSGGTFNALSAKQDKLHGQPGQVVGFDGMGLAYAVAGWSNPNLLDNWYFADPVNQRGQTEYVNDGYTIDLWGGFGRNVKLEGSDGIKMTANVVWGRITQNIENSDLAGKTVTFSVLYKGLSSGNIYIYLGPGNVQLAFSYAESGLITGTAVLPTDTNLHVFIAMDTVGASVNLIAAKLELGLIQTLAHQDASGNWVLNDPPPNKALELAKCMRHQIVYSSNADNLMLFSGKVNSASTRAYFSAIFPQPLAVVPSLFINDISKFYVYDGTNYVPKSVSIATADSCPDGVKVVTLSCDITGLGVKSEAMAYFSLANGAQLIFDANVL